MTQVKHRTKSGKLLTFKSQEAFEKWQKGRFAGQKASAKTRRKLQSTQRVVVPPKSTRIPKKVKKSPAATLADIEAFKRAEKTHSERPVPNQLIDEALFNRQTGNVEEVGAIWNANHGSADIVGIDDFDPKTGNLGKKQMEVAKQRAIMEEERRQETAKKLEEKEVKEIKGTEDKLNDLILVELRMRQEASIIANHTDLIGRVESKQGLIGLNDEEIKVIRKINNELEGFTRLRGREKEVKERLKKIEEIDKETKRTKQKAIESMADNVIKGYGVHDSDKSLIGQELKKKADELEDVEFEILELERTGKQRKLSVVIKNPDDSQKHLANDIVVLREEVQYLTGIKENNKDVVKKKLIRRRATSLPPLKDKERYFVLAKETLDPELKSYKFTTKEKALEGYLDSVDINETFAKAPKGNLLKEKKRTFHIITAKNLDEARDKIDLIGKVNVRVENFDFSDRAKRKEFNDKFTFGRNRFRWDRESKTYRGSIDPKNVDLLKKFGKPIIEKEKFTEGDRLLLKADKLEAKADRRLDQAERLNKKSESTLEEARKKASRIPLGQPIITGRGAQTRADINNRERIDNKFRKGIEEGKEAEVRERKAGNLNRTAKQIRANVNPDKRQPKSADLSVGDVVFTPLSGVGGKLTVTKVNKKTFDAIDEKGQDRHFRREYISERISQTPKGEKPTTKEVSVMSLYRKNIVDARKKPEEAFETLQLTSNAIGFDKVLSASQKQQLRKEVKAKDKELKQDQPFVARRQKIIGETISKGTLKDQEAKRKRKDKDKAYLDKKLTLPRDPNRPPLISGKMTLDFASQFGITRKDHTRIINELGSRDTDKLSKSDKNLLLEVIDRRRFVLNSKSSLTDKEKKQSKELEQVAVGVRGTLKATNKAVIVKKAVDRISGVQEAKKKPKPTLKPKSSISFSSKDLEAPDNVSFWIRKGKERKYRKITDAKAIANATIGSGKETYLYQLDKNISKEEANKELLKHEKTNFGKKGGLRGKEAEEFLKKSKAKSLWIPDAFGSVKTKEFEKVLENDEQYRKNKKRINEDLKNAPKPSKVKFVPLGKAEKQIAKRKPVELGSTVPKASFLPQTDERGNSYEFFKGFDGKVRLIGVRDQFNKQLNPPDITVKQVAKKFNIQEKFTIDYGNETS